MKIVNFLLIVAAQLDSLQCGHIWGCSKKVLRIIAVERFNLPALSLGGLGKWHHFVGFVLYREGWIWLVKQLLSYTFSG